MEVGGGYILDLLISRKVISRSDLVADSEGSGKAIRDHAAYPALHELVDAGLTSYGEIRGILAAEFDMPEVQLQGRSVDLDILELVHPDWARSKRLLPLSRHNETIQVAICDPSDVDAVDDLAHQTNSRIEPLIAAIDDVEAALNRLYPETGEVDSTEPEALSRTADSDQLPGPPQAAASPRAGEADLFADGRTDDTPIVNYVEFLIREAVRRRASDIHLEPLASRFRVRYRVDGSLIEGSTPPQRLQASIVSRVKLLADISIAERRLPQDGRMRMLLDGRSVDLRVSSLPTVHGESVVMRILDRESADLSLRDLGMGSLHREALEEIVSQPDGIVLVTGPTGSGKSTTLYACLEFLNRSDRKIITIEDPVEIRIQGINQVQVQREVGMTFSAALRAMLRQAPNIIMVGEIRDQETAEIAINASLTGHMVFSTLHTNDAASSITRLTDIGVEPYLVSSALRAVLGQRLVRLICPSCSEPDQPEPQVLKALGIHQQRLEKAHFKRGRGCRHCQGRGYRGRTGVFELLVIDDEFEKLIYNRQSLAGLRSRARELGMRSLREDGLNKAASGATTIDEVLAITVQYDENMVHY